MHVHTTRGSTDSGLSPAELVEVAAKLNLDGVCITEHGGNWTDAERELQIAEQLYGADIQSIRIPQLANAYAQMGRRDEVQRLFAALEMQAQDGPVNAALWALMYLALENYDQALEWLEVAVDDQAPDLVTLGEIKANPYADPVLDEPRFQELRDRIGT